MQKAKRGHQQHHRPLNEPVSTRLEVFKRTPEQKETKETHKQLKQQASEMENKLPVSPKLGQISITGAKLDQKSVSVESHKEKDDVTSSRDKQKYLDPFIPEQDQEMDEEDELFEKRARTLSENPSSNNNIGSGERHRRSSLELPDHAKLQRAVQLKARGNDMFYESQYFDALEHFKKAGKIFMDSLKTTPFLRETTNVQDLLNECRLNVALCYLYMQQYDSTINMITSLMQLDENQRQNPKALYLRGEAYAGKNQYVLALSDVNEAERLKPRDPSIQKLAKQLRENIKFNKIIQHHPTLSNSQSTLATLGSNLSANNADLNQAIKEAQGPLTQNYESGKEEGKVKFSLKELLQMTFVIFRHKFLKKPANLLGLILVMVVCYYSSKSFWRMRKTTWRWLKSLFFK